MRRIEIALGELKDNPFKKEIQNGAIDQDKVATLVDSMQTTAVWEQWVGRRNDKGQIEIAFGHHRKAAAIKLKTANYKVSVQIEDWTDDQMFQALANENQGNDATESVKMDVVRVARERLLEDPSRCSTTGDRHAAAGTSKFARKDNQHVHGSSPCVSKYLSRDGKVWGESTVRELLQKNDNLDKSLRGEIAPPLYTISGRKLPDGKLRSKDATALTGLEKTAQKEAFKELQTAQKNGIEIPSVTVKKAVEEARAEVIRKVEPEQRKAVTAVIEAATDLPKAQQKAIVEAVVEKINAAPNSKAKEEAATTAVNAAFKKAGVEVKGTTAAKVFKAAQAPVIEAQPQVIREVLSQKIEQARIDALPDANNVAAKLARRFTGPGWLDAETRKELERLLDIREHLDSGPRKDLVTALNKAANQLRSHADTLAAPPQKRLKA